MKSKIIFTLLTIGVTFLQAGFFSHDKAYYDAHPEEAESKFKLCNKAIDIALGKGDMKLAERYDKDEECRAAKKAYIEHRNAVEKAKREAERKKAEQIRAQQEAAFKAEYEKQLQIFKQADFATFMALGAKECTYYYPTRYRRANLSIKDAKCKAWKELESAKKEAAFKAEYEKQLQIFKQADFATFMALGAKECAHYYPVGPGGMNFSTKDTKCKAWKELEPTKKSEQIDMLLKTYPHAKLLAYRDKVCKGSSYGNPKCDMARLAVKKETENQIQAYLADKDKLKHDFNTCFQKIQALRLKGKYNQAIKVQKSYQCTMPAKAALKLKIYGYSNPMK